MTNLLTSLMLTVMLGSVCFAQQEPLAYGDTSDLKGLKKVFIDSGLDTQSRNSIVKDLQKANLGFKVVDDIETAEIILGFGAGRVIDRVTGTTRDGVVNIRTQSSRTGVGVVIARARGKDRIVHSFKSTQESGEPLFVSAFKRKPVANFVREFLKLYKKANDLK